jgi:hypothetical protein
MDYLKVFDDISLKMGINVFVGNDPQLDKSTPATLLPTPPPPPPINAFYPFKLPIEYQPQEQIQELSTVVVSDLELADSASQTPMYDFLFQPKNDFSKKIIQEWKKNISTDVAYLKETQEIIKNAGTIDVSNMVNENTERLTAIWNDLKNDPFFLEKYSYMEIDFFKYLNQSETFLQTVTFANMASPLTSFLFPVIVLILPFIILSFQRNTLSFSTYITVLKDLAKNHFIGKIITNLENLDYSKIGYLVLSIGMYLLQIYNNFITCFHFYRNVQKINDDIIYLRDFIQRSCKNMYQFVELHSLKTTYSMFCKDVVKYRDILKEIDDQLLPIDPFTVSFSKFNKVGYMLKCYYRLYFIPEYADALQFAFGFEGYIGNIKGIYNNLKTGAVSLASFIENDDSTLVVEGTSSPPLIIKEQYYPPHDPKTAVKNNIKMGGSSPTLKQSVSEPTITQQPSTNGVIITGPNASGKTTLLKTTAINIIFSQQVGVGYYSKSLLKPYKYIHSYLNIPDTSGRDSLFQAEARRCKDIIDSISSSKSTDGHFCIFDELYSGTNPVEASKASFAFLNYLTDYNNVSFILTTHYSCVCRKIVKEKMTKICNYKMDVKETEVENGENSFNYTYKMIKGISTIEGAINVLKSLNYPEKIIQKLVEGSKEHTGNSVV